MGLESLLGTAAGGLNPLSLATSATQIGIGGLQALFSGKKKAERDLESLKSPIYQGSKPITDYYNEAKNRYNVSPYQSTQYQVAKQNAERATATGLNALQGRGSAMAGVSRLIGLQNDNELKATQLAEQERNQRFGQLGGATQMKAGDDRFKFNQNEIVPFENQRQLLAAKAGAANQRQSAGFQNIFGGLGSLGELASAYKKQPSYPNKASIPSADTIPYDRNTVGYPVPPQNITGKPINLSMALNPNKVPSYLAGKNRGYGVLKDGSPVDFYNNYDWVNGQ